MNVLDTVPLFSSLDERQRALIWDCMVPDKRKAGEYLYQQGELATRMYLIKSGWVRLSNDQLAALANLSQGSLLGDNDALLGRRYGTTAEAVTDVEAWALEDAALAAAIARDPGIGVKLGAIYRANVVPLLQYLVEHRLRPIPGMGELTDEALVTIAGRLCVHPVEAGEIVFSAGQAPSSLYILDDGRVEAGDPGAATREYRPGDLVTERSILLGRSHTTTARAITACRLWELSTVDFDRLCGLYPDLRAILSRVLQSRPGAADQSQTVSLLKATPIFQGLPPDALDELATNLVWQMAPAGTHIFEANAPAASMYFVESGGVELIDQRNEPQARISAGSYFGEDALSDASSYGLGAVARGNTTLWALSRADVESVAEHYPAVRRLLSNQASPAAARTGAAEHFAERHLRRLGLFAGLTPDQLRQVAGQLTEQHFNAGQIIYRRGQVNDALYLIEQGRVSAQNRMPDGSVRVLGNMGPGEFFGETALLTGDPEPSDAFAQQEVDAWMLTRQDFESMLMQYPMLAVNLSRTLSHRLRESNEQVSTGIPQAAAIPAQPPVAAQTAASFQAAASPVMPAPARPAPARLPAAKPIAPAEQPQVREQLAKFASWFSGLNILTKVQLVALALLLIWLIVIAAPSLVMSIAGKGSPQQAANGKGGFLETSVSVALAASNEEAAGPAPTYTPWPTETPPVSATEIAQVTAPTSAPTQEPTQAAPATTSPTATAAASPTAAPAAAAAVEPSATPAPQLATGKPHVTAKDTVNLRGGPGTNYAVVGQLQGGQSYDIMGRNAGGDWWRIAFPSEDQVWVNGSLVDVIGTVTSVAIMKNIPTAPTPVVVEQAQLVAVAQAPAAKAAAPAAAAPAAKPAHQYTIKEIYHLTGCENGWNHNIFVVVQDPAGNPIDGIKVGVRPGDMTDPVFTVLVTGNKGPGKDEFPMYKGGQYAVYVTNDGSSLADSDAARNLGSVRDPGGNLWPETKCNGDNGNTIGHNSMRVTFVKNW